MIKVLFPPGCYGTFLAKCIYNFSDLREHQFEDFIFQNSSSHDHRLARHARSVINQGHLTNMVIDNDDEVITVLPSNNHALDYFNNQFHKQQNQHLTNYILAHTSEDEFKNKLKTQWGYEGSFDFIPRWVIREWCSYWIQDVLDNSYNNAEEYKVVKSLYQLETQSLFIDFKSTLENVFSVLKLSFSVDTQSIERQHNRFVELQLFHNSEIKCNQLVNDLLTGVDSKILLQTVFEEAYIQHLLRSHNIEISCNDLNVFPTSTAQLKNITYEASHNHSS